MKKLIMAAAIVCAAVATQAAQISWKTGSGIAPEGTTAAANTLTLAVFLVDSTTYANTDISSIWGNYGAETVADVTGAASYSKTGGGSMGVTAAQPTGDVAANTTYYALILTMYDKDADGKVDFYAANKSSVATNGSASPISTTPTGNLAKYIGGDSGAGNVTWTAAAVPEPTSGLLLLLGMAGLALRRKQK